MHFFVGSWLRGSGYRAALPNADIHRRRRLFYGIASGSRSGPAWSRQGSFKFSVLSD